MDDELTLELFLDQLGKWRSPPGDVVRRLWRHYEASQAALSRALEENRVEHECLEIAQDALRRCAGGLRRSLTAQVALEEIAGRQAELEVQ